jgi:DNA-binding transcriptional LysR family regulator
MTRAAMAMHITQPTLSRQIHDLEDELGKQLFERNSHSVTLTHEGRLLRKRAEEILELVQQTADEVARSDESISGDVCIGAGESVGVHYLTQVAYQLRCENPDIHFHISSGDSMDVLERLDKGEIDFGLLFDPVNLEKYHSIKLPYEDTWGCLVRCDSPLASKSQISSDDLVGQPLILSRQSRNSLELREWFGSNAKEINVVGTYSLVFNGSLMVEDGIGYALCLDKIINVTGDSTLRFLPLYPQLKASMHIVWRKYQNLSKASERYLALLLAQSES